MSRRLIEPTIMYKGWAIRLTGQSNGGILVFKAVKENEQHIGATSMEYCKKCIDFKENNGKYPNKRG